MKKAIIAIITAVVLAFSANAQPYSNSVGLYFDPSWSGDAHILGVQWNHFLNQKNLLDIRAGYQFKWGPLVDAAFEWYVPFGNSGFSFHGGPGVHLGIITDYDFQGHACADIGFTGVAGFEYAFSGAPLALSIDWRPYLTWVPKIDNKAEFGYAGIDFGIKYCF